MREFHFSPLQCMGPVVHLVIYLALLGVAVWQWLRILPLARGDKVFWALPHDEVVRAKSGDGSTLPGKLRQVPFAQDWWFIIWNLLPILLLGFYGYVWANWEVWSASLESRFALDWRTEFYGSWLGLLFYAVPIGAAIVVSVLAWLAQPKKLGLSTEIYWWHKDLSPRCWDVRRLALLPVTFTVVIVFAVIAHLIAVLTAAAFAPPVPSFLHPDGLAGFGHVGVLTLAVAGVCFGIAGFYIVAWFDHRNAPVFHPDGYVVVGASLLGVLMFVAVPVLIHVRVLALHAPVGREAAAAIEEVEVSLRLRADPPEATPDWARRVANTMREEADVLAVADRLVQPPRFPLNLGGFVQMLALLIAPLAGYLTKKFWKPPRAAGASGGAAADSA